MTDRDGYYATARDWALDTRAREGRLVRMAWIVAGIAASVALFEAVALALLTPLKTVQPITVLVDRQTGFVQAIDPTKPRRISADAALTQSLLAQYVAAREGFDRATISTEYRRVALWSDGQARRQYLALLPATNPESPLQRLAPGTIVETRVKSVSNLSPDTAMVRFDTQAQDRTGRISAPQAWLSVLRYRFVNAPMAFEDRLVNPLGFQVTKYRRDAELPAASASAPASPVAVDATRAALATATARAILERQGYTQPAATTPSTLLTRGSTQNQIPLGSPLGPFAASTSKAGDPS